MVLSNLSAAMGSNLIGTTFMNPDPITAAATPVPEIVPARGLTQGLPHKNVELRAAQVEAAGDFYERMGEVLIKPPARKRLIEAYERRLKQEIERGEDAGAFRDPGPASGVSAALREGGMKLAGVVDWRHDGRASAFASGPVVEFRRAALAGPGAAFYGLFDN
jgi:hypothetical protein